jgi:glucose/arabinose dehydrogenase
MSFPTRGILAAGAALIVSLTAIPLFAQTGAGLLEGTAAFGDWRADRPGTRRLIRPQDLPAPDMAQSVRNSVRIMRRTDDQKPIVPNGFEVNLFASGLLEPRILRVAPNGDVFVAESSAGQIKVLRPNGTSASDSKVFATGLMNPFGIAF